MSTTHSKDRSSDCTFTFADGRRCRMPRQSGHPFLCCFHARREAQAQAAEEVGRENEYINAFSTDSWRRVIHSHVKENSHYLTPTPPPAPIPAVAPVRVEPAEQLPAEASTQSADPLDSRTPATCRAGSTPASFPEVAVPSSNTRHPDAAPVEAGLQPGSSSTAEATRISVQPSTQASSATHEGPGSSSPVSRSARRNLSQPNQEPGFSNHADVPAARNSFPADPDSVSSAAAASPSAEDASLPAATGFLAKVGSSAPPRLPRSGAEFASTILASARSSHPVGQTVPPCSAGFTPASSLNTTAPKPSVPAPEAVPPTGPSGAPLLAALPPRDHAPRPVRRGRQIRPWYLPQ